MPNETGSAHHSAQIEMAAFDKLPKSLRKVPNNTKRNFSSLQILEEWKYSRSCAELIRAIKIWDKRIS